MRMLKCRAQNKKKSVDKIAEHKGVCSNILRYCTAMVKTSIINCIHEKTCYRCNTALLAKREYSLQTVFFSLSGFTLSGRCT